MKFAFVIAALFAASAIAAPCGKRNEDQVSDVVDSPVLDDPSAPTDVPVNDTTASDDVPLDDTPASSPSSDQDEETTSTEVTTTNDQTAVINDKSGEKGGKGSLFGFDVSNIGSEGLFSHASNSIAQNNH